MPSKPPIGGGSRAPKSLRANGSSSSDDQHDRSRLGRFVGQLRTATSILFQRASLAARAGFTHDGKRNTWGVFGYPRNVRFEDYLVWYTRGDIAKRIVNQPAASTWQDGIQVTGSQEFNDRWEEIVADRDLWNVLETADKLAGIGRYATVLLGFDDGNDLSMPVTFSPERRLLYLQPYSQMQGVVTELESDTQNERFGLPSMYQF